MFGEEDNGFSFDEFQWQLTQNWKDVIEDNDEESHFPFFAQDKESQNFQQPVLSENKEISNLNWDKQTQETKGIEESTIQAISILQKRGQIMLKDLISEIEIDHHRGYDIINVLLMTPLVTSLGNKKVNGQPLIWYSSRKTSHQLDVSRLTEDLKEQKN
jgi:hypothetical protein